MNSKDLKKLIKQLVKESLTEIFVEMKLETIVENVLVKKITEQKQATLEDVSEDSFDTSNSKILKEKIRENLRVDDSEWNSIYGNIDVSSNPIINDSTTNPELVSKSQLVESGLYRDYSKFVK